MPEPAPTRPRVLVTGFSVFGSHQVNPTELLVPRLAAEKDKLPCDLHGEVFPVDYNLVPGRLQKCFDEGPYDVAIHFGLHAFARGITLEGLARNANRSTPDVAGFVPPTIIQAGGIDMSSTLPIGALQADLEAAGFPVCISDDAGGYLCNYTFYLSRLSNPGRMCGFIHLPPLREGKVTDPPNSMALEEMLAAAKLIIRSCCAEYVRTSA